MPRSGPLITVGVTASVIGITLAQVVAARNDDQCSGLVSSKTVTPLIVAGVIAFATIGACLVERHRDIHGERKTWRHQFWRILAAALIAVCVVGLGLLLIAARYAANCQPS